MRTSKNQRMSAGVGTVVRRCARACCRGRPGVFSRGGGRQTVGRSAHRVVQGNADRVLVVPEPLTEQQVLALARRFDDHRQAPSEDELGKDGLAYRHAGGVAEKPSSTRKAAMRTAVPSGRLTGDCPGRRCSEQGAAGSCRTRLSNQRVLSRPGSPFHPPPAVARRTQQLPSEPGFEWAGPAPRQVDHFDTPEHTGMPAFAWRPAVAGWRSVSGARCGGAILNLNDHLLSIEHLLNHRVVRPLLSTTHAYTHTTERGWALHTLMHGRCTTHGGSAKFTPSTTVFAPASINSEMRGGGALPQTACCVRRKLACTKRYRAYVKMQCCRGRGGPASRPSIDY